MLCGLSGLLGVNPLHCVGSSVVLANNLSFLETLYPLVFSLLQKVSTVILLMHIIVFSFQVMNALIVCGSHRQHGVFIISVVIVSSAFSGVRCIKIRRKRCVNAYR